jgi:hypothetical protein
MGSKTQRQNQHVRRLEAKIKRHKSKGRDTSKMEKELGYCTGDSRPEFKTGRDADPRLKKHR